MPKLWSETIETHRLAVRDGVLDATWALVMERGMLSVTMSEIAQKTGIGRATLYKYFPDVESILLAHHQRRVAGHLAGLTEMRAQSGGPRQQLEAVLTEFGRICFHRGRHLSGELSALLHRGETVVDAQRQIRDLIRDLVLESERVGDVRDDVGAEELADYCLHALSAAGGLSSEDAVERLVSVTLAGMRPVR